MVVIIDELDRCRPLFAIEVLEKAKHLFNVGNVVFVIGIDREQLGHSIRTVYGAGMDPEGYLRRFIDMNFNLPNPILSSTALGSYCYEMLKFINVGNMNEGNFKTGDIINLVVSLGTSYEMSVRDIEHSFSAISLLGNNLKHVYYKCFLVTFFSIYKIANRKMYEKMKTNSLTADDICSDPCFAKLPNPKPDTFDRNMLFAYLLLLSVLQKDAWDDNGINWGVSNIFSEIQPNVDSACVREILKEIRSSFHGGLQSWRTMLRNALKVVDMTDPME